MYITCVSIVSVRGARASIAVLAMRPQSCKSKGRRFQQRIAQSILDAFPHLARDDVGSTSMGAQGEDIKLSAVARSAVPLSIECKCVEKINVWACIEQAKANCPDGATPCVVFSKNRAASFAVVPWDALLLVLQRLHNQGDLPPRAKELISQLAQLLEEKDAPAPNVVS